MTNTKTMICLWSSSEFGALKRDFLTVLITLYIIRASSSVVYFCATVFFKVASLSVSIVGAEDQQTNRQSALIYYDEVGLEPGTSCITQTWCQRLTAISSYKHSLYLINEVDIRMRGVPPIYFKFSN